MIIKTLSRKKPSFFQLYDYMKDGSDDKEIAISRNLHSTNNRYQVLQEFTNNHKLTRNIKNGNALYHDIISFPNIKEVSIERQTAGSRVKLKEKQIARQKEAITILADKYLEKRAKDNIAIGYIHTETNNLHLHLMISSNPKNEPSRHRLSKLQLKEIQKELELYKQQEFPELGRELIYTKEREIEAPNYQSSKSKDQEYQLKHRTKKLSRKDQLKQVLAEIILDSYSKTQLQKKLQKHNLELYERGKTAGIIDLEEQFKGKTKVKHRFKTLGLQLEYENLLEFDRSSEIERRKQEMEKIRENKRSRENDEREG